MCIATVWVRITKCSPLLYGNAREKKVPVDAFGHHKLDKVNAGQWVGEHMKKATGALKVMTHAAPGVCVGGR